MNWFLVGEANGPDYEPKELARTGDARKFMKVEGGKLFGCIIRA